MAMPKRKTATVEDLSVTLDDKPARPAKEYREIVQRPGDVIRKPNIREMLAEAPISKTIRDPLLSPKQAAEKMLSSLERIEASKVFHKMTPPQSCGLTGAIFLLREMLGMENNKPMVVAIHALIGSVSQTDPVDRAIERIKTIASARERRGSWETIDNKQRYAINGGLKALQEVCGVKENDLRVTLKSWLNIDPETGHGVGNSVAV